MEFLAKFMKYVFKFVKFIPKLFRLYFGRVDKELCELIKWWNKLTLGDKITALIVAPVTIQVTIWHYSYQEGLKMTTTWRSVVYDQDVFHGASLYMDLTAIVNGTAAYLLALFIVRIFGSFLMYSMRCTAYRKPEDKGLANVRHRPNGDHVLLLLFMFLSLLLFLLASTYFITTRNHIVWYVYSFVSIVYHIFYAFYLRSSWSKYVPFSNKLAGDPDEDITLWCRKFFVGNSYEICLFVSRMLLCFPIYCLCAIISINTASFLYPFCG